jgi:hypothetical protein
MDRYRRPMPNPENIAAVGFQQGACKNLGSAFYAGLLGNAVARPDDSHAFWSVLDAFSGNPRSSLTPLRLLGSLHHLVLAGRAPELAAHFPRNDSPGDPDAAWAVLDRVIRDEWAFVRGRLDDEVQTNEVRRSAALLPGFMVVHERAGLPLRLAELGSSAGLNLCWDRYRYALGPHEWGPEDAPIRISTRWSGPAPPLHPIEISNRRGCDIAPLDISREEDLVRLRSFVWPDQFERMALLDSALRAAVDLDIALEAVSAADFVSDVLGDQVDGQVSVVFHSIMWMYVPEAERERIQRDLDAAGRRASATRPLAWLRMEFVDDKQAALWLNYWPGNGEREKLADCHYHGTSIDWIGA